MARRDRVIDEEYEVLQRQCITFMMEDPRAIRRTLDIPSAMIWLARSWIQPVASLLAGPPSGGLYLNPPSRGGLCDGVTTIPSARCASRPRL